MTFTAVKTRSINVDDESLKYKFGGNILIITPNINWEATRNMTAFFTAYGATVDAYELEEIINFKKNDSNYSLDQYTQIYDLCYNYSIENYSIELIQMYYDYLEDFGGKLYLQGENNNFDYRNSVIRYIVNNKFGGHIDMGSNPDAGIIYQRGSAYFTNTFNNAGSTRSTIKFPSSYPQLLVGDYVLNGQSYTGLGPGFGQYRYVDWTSVIFDIAGLIIPRYIPFETSTMEFENVETADENEWNDAYLHYARYIGLAGIEYQIPVDYEYHTAALITSEYMLYVHNPKAKVIVCLDVNFLDLYFYTADSYSTNYKSESFWNDSLGQGQNLLAAIYQEFNN